MAKGGSQLAQLKSSVKAAGVTDRRQQNNASKKRKRGGASSERDEAAARREALARIGSDTKFNPFDEKVTKVKHDILGNKVRGAVGRPALAKQGGQAQRLSTLLPEYQQRNRSGTFIDRRFGETDSNLTPEEKMLERFTKEKQRQAKGKKAALFNLNDDEGREEELTHFGRSLSAMGSLPELSMIGDGEDDAGQIDSGTTAADHFGGFEAENPDRPKTKAEVMREIMAKSKMHKMERQQMRDADDELRAQLDDDLGDIRSLLMTGKPGEQEARREDPSQVAGPSKPSGREGNDYDSYVRELAFERRAKPQDRLKTDIELAEEEAEQLRKAEQARLKRMRGEELGSDEETSAQHNRQRRPAQGDDLDDDFHIEGQSAAETYGLGSGLGESAHADASDAEDGEDDEEGDESDVNDEEDEDEDEDGSQDPALEQEGYGEELDDDDGDEEGEEEIELAPKAAATKPKSKSKSKVDSKAKGANAVPFTFACPVTHDDLLAALDEHSLSPEQVPLVIKRIRALHHPSLAEDNKFKLQAFIGVLLDHALYSANQAVAATSSDDRVAQLDLVDHLLRPIFELSTAYPTAAAEHFVEKLALMERNLSKALSRGATKREVRTWPGAAELTLLRIAGLVWPTSDLNHTVATPLMLLEAHYLAHARIRSYADIASGLYLVSLIVQQQGAVLDATTHAQEARRMMPEALNFMQNVLMLLMPFDGKKQRQAARSCCQRYAVPMPDFEEDHSRHLTLTPAGTATPRHRPDLFALLAATETASPDKQKATDLLGLALELVIELAELYRGTAAFIELFEPLRLVTELGSFSQESDSSPKDTISSLASQQKTTLSTLQAHLDESRRSRRPLRLHAHRAIPLASFIPKFDEGGKRSRYGGGSGAFDPDSQRAEEAKLRALVRKERKGALRELRRDAQFLAQHRAQEKRSEDDEYKRKMGKIVAGLGEERGEEKRLQKEKARLQRKSGK